MIDRMIDDEDDRQDAEVTYGDDRKCPVTNDTNVNISSECQCDVE